MKHIKKIWTEFYDAVENGTKSFDVRIEDPNEPKYNVGDGIRFIEYDPIKGYTTNREMHRVIIYILRDTRFLPEGTVVLGLRKYESYKGT